MIHVEPSHVSKHFSHVSSVYDILTWSSLGLQTLKFIPLIGVWLQDYLCLFAPNSQNNIKCELVSTAHMEVV